MANPEHLEILKQGVKVWNEWRRDNHWVEPNLREADLRNASLAGADLTSADLTNALLIGADLTNANLSCYRNHNSSNFYHLKSTSLLGADLSGANLREANLVRADLKKSNLVHAELREAILSRAYLTGADFSETIMKWTTFAFNNLSTVKGLETVRHLGESFISIDTIFLSKGKIPEIFLRGAGVPEDFITYINSLTIQPIQFYSCFISYSHKDEEFAQRLYSRMRQANLRVWYAPEEMKGGAKLHEQIFDAIQIHDKLLLVLSEDSLQSEWVITEIRRARKVEREENRRKLFPIRLVDFNTLQAWECFDADVGKDLATEVREYFIPDFSNWKDYDDFEAAFAKLLRDLKADGKGI